MDYCFFSFGFIMLQILYYDFFKVFYTLYSLSNSKQIAAFYTDIIELMKHNVLWIVLCFIPFFIYIIYERKKMVMKHNTWKISLCQFFISILYFGLGLSLLLIPSVALNTPLDIYKERSINESSVNQFGLMSALRFDIESLFLGKTEIVIKEDKKEPVKEISYEAQVMDIDFDALISSTDNETIQNMHRYFQSIAPTKKNEYTGVFKDYNLILLTCEGFSPYSIHAEVTPTLYKLANEGIRFTNFYTPLWPVSTSDGEYVATQSLYPKPGTWSFRDSSNNYLPFALGNQFKKLGYTTKAYHNHYYEFYDRHLSHPNMGYEYKGLGNGLNVVEQWPESDLEMMEKSVDEFINEDRFHVYYMTVSGHTNYTWKGNRMASKNKLVVQNLPYSDMTKGYLATQVELDRALEYLIKRLEKSGKAENTLIAMSADHYPYGLPKENYNELAGHEIEENFELYKNEFIIWSASMKKPMEVNKLGSSIDIIPTLSNLLGLEYDSRLLMGKDLLSDSEPLVIFDNNSFITDKVMYNAKTNEVKWLNNKKEDMDYLKKINEIVKQKRYYSEQILSNDYYKHVKEKGI